MAIKSIKNPNKDLLKILKGDDSEVRFYLGEKTPIYGKIHQIEEYDLFILPYLVWENVPTPNVEKFLNRCRMETKYPKIVPINNISPEPLSKGTIEQFAKLQNYFNSLMINNEEMRKKVFNKDIYLMPSDEEIKFIKETLPKI